MIFCAIRKNEPVVHLSALSNLFFRVIKPFGAQKYDMASSSIQEATPPPQTYMVSSVIAETINNGVDLMTFITMCKILSIVLIYMIAV